MSIDPAALLSQVSALMGALIGGGASLAVAIYNQRSKERLHLVGAIHRMRLFAPQDVIDTAEAVLKAIVEVSLKPSIELRQLARQALSQSPDPDPFLKFSLICRADLDSVHRNVR